MASDCPACRREVVGEGTACPDCGTTYHEECWARLPIASWGTGCVVTGCAGPPGAPEQAVPSSALWPVVRRAWIVTGAVFVAGILRGAGPRFVGRDTFGNLALAVLAIAWVTTALASLSDMRQGLRDRPDRWGTFALFYLTWFPVLAGIVIAFASWAVGRPGHPDVVIEALSVVIALPLLSMLVGLLVDRRRHRALGAVAILLVAAVFPEVTGQRHHQARERARTRACYAQQKTLAGALEMYNLDRSTRVTTVDVAFQKTLRSGGYLQSTPNDPGEGEGSGDNYQWMPTGCGVRCKVHGAIQ